MGHILKNQNLEVHIDPPFEKYRGARFDEVPQGGWFHKIGVGLLKKMGRITSSIGTMSLILQNFRSASSR